MKSNLTRVRIGLQDPEVEFHRTYINYDLQSLISEIGGILGLTLGASFMTLLHFVDSRLRLRDVL